MSIFPPRCPPLPSLPPSLPPPNSSTNTRKHVVSSLSSPLTVKQPCGCICVRAVRSPPPPSPRLTELIKIVEDGSAARRVDSSGASDPPSVFPCYFASLLAWTSTWTKEERRKRRGGQGWEENGALMRFLRTSGESERRELSRISHIEDIMHFYGARARALYAVCPRRGVMRMLLS